MRLLLVTLAGLLMDGEAFKAFQKVQLGRPILFVMHPPQFYERVRAGRPMLGAARGGPGSPIFGIGGGESVFMGLQSPRSTLSRAPTIANVPSQGQITDSLGQSSRPSEDGQTFSPFSSSHKQSPSAVNQDHSPLGVDQTPKISTPSFHNPSPSVSVEQHQHSEFDQASEISSFDPSHQPSGSQDFKPSSFEESNKPSSSDEDNKHPSFGTDKKPSDKDKKTSLFNTQGSHPNRNPVCNIRPDPGTCRAALPRYYWDPETATCNCFLYGGCTEHGEDESPGNFFTLEECQRECHPPNMEEGPICKDIFKEDQFISYLVDDPPSQNARTDHLNDEEFLSSFFK